MHNIGPDCTVTKNKLDEFFLEIREFRNKFRKEAPFTHDGPVDEAYASMDGFIVELKELQVNIDHFSELEELFEHWPVG